MHIRCHTKNFHIHMQYADRPSSERETTHTKQTKKKKSSCSSAPFPNAFVEFNFIAHDLSSRSTTIAQWNLWFCRFDLSSSQNAMARRHNVRGRNHITKTWMCKTHPKCAMWARSRYFHYYDLTAPTHHAPLMLSWPPAQAGSVDVASEKKQAMLMHNF